MLNALSLKELDYIYQNKLKFSLNLLKKLDNVPLSECLFPFIEKIGIACPDLFLIEPSELNVIFETTNSFNHFDEFLKVSIDDLNYNEVGLVAFSSERTLNFNTDIENESIEHLTLCKFAIAAKSFEHLVSGERSNDGIHLHITFFKNTYL